MNDALYLHGLLGGSAAAPTEAWVRPSDWLTLPTISDSDHKFVGLHAVYPQGSNFCALTAAGNYTVDWGDGLTENFATGVVAYHEYDYSDADLVGTECSRGYKQVIVTVTPQAGQSFTTLNLHKKHSKTGLQKYSSGFLDIAIAGASLTTLLVGSSDGTSATTILTTSLEQVSLYQNGVANFSYMFTACSSLKSVSLLNTAAGTNFSNMFDSCYTLSSVPLLNTAAGTNFSNMFKSCLTLTAVPLLNTAAGTNFSGMFSTCSALSSVPSLNTAAGTNFSNMFSTCRSLSSLPLFNTAAGTSFNNMLINCSALSSVPSLNTAAGTNFSGMFSGCFALSSVPLLNTAAGTDFSSMFNNCGGLPAVPALVVSGATTSSGHSFMFSGCTSLSKIECVGFKFTFSVGACKLDTAALDALYGNLATVTGQTITVSNNHGNNADTPAIATAKGWTVTG